MRNLRRLFLFTCFVAIAFLAQVQPAHARVVEGDGSLIERLETSATSWWKDVKTKVSTWWNKDSPQPTRQVASEPAPNASAPATSPAPAQAVPQVSPSEVAARKSQLPAYSDNGSREAAKQTTRADLDKVRAQKAIVESKPGRAADAQLPRAKSGVVSFSLTKKVEVSAKGGKKKYDTIQVTDIPYLDIGEEPILSRSEWGIQPLDIRVSEFQAPKALNSPELAKDDVIKTAMGAPVEKVANAKDIKVSAFGPGDRVTFETVRKISYQTKPETPVTELPVQLMSSEELKLLKAEIFLEKDNKCHLVTGILSDLTNSQNEVVRGSANYHLTLCLHKMGLFTESVRRMKDVIKTASKQQIGEALKVLVADLPMEFEDDVASELKKVDVTLVPEDSRDSFHYIIAKASAREGHFNTAYDAAEKVSRKFKNYSEAQFIMAIAEYALDRKGKALERMTTLKKYIDDHNGDKNLRALVSINLGRMAFQEKKYKEAIDNFLEIKKDHPLWVEALIEQGWTQIQLNDNAGAIGNMYSIHSPYFKSVYQPESFVIRTIGYLGICQYGDAYRTLSQLEQMHRGWLNQIQNYRKTANTGVYYQSLVKYLKSPNTQQSIDGLPYQILREIGRHKDFLNLQEAINNRVDEMEQYAFVNSLINKEKSSLQWLVKKSNERLADLSVKIKKAEKGGELAKELNNFKRQRAYEDNVLDGLKFQLQVYDESQKSFAQLQKVGMQRIQQKKADLQAAAGEVLKTRLKKMEVRLSSILENNELLRYETFAGSGENIRYHATATGQVAKINEKRMPYTAKPESKSLQWQFDGEFWEDEIGHYRSSLKDNCPQNRRVSGTN